jgi:hypothetical protein
MMRRNIISQIVGILLCFAMGITILSMGEVIPRWRNMKVVASWVKTEAVLTKHTIKKHPEEDAYSVIKYKYHYQGNDYTSEQYSFEYLKPLLSSQKYIEGMKLVCYVDPKNPSQAVLSTNIEPFKKAIGFSLMFIISGFIFLVLVIYHCLKLKNQQGDKSLRYYFDDPVANKTEWFPLPSKIGRGGGFQIYKLSKDGLSRYCYLPTLRFFLFCFILLASAVYFIIDCPKEKIILPLGGFIVLLLVFCFLFTSKKFVFDNSEKAFWYTNFFGFGRRYSYTHFKDIYALQIIYVLDLGGDGIGFSDYQINLVLTNGQRIYLISQPTLKKAQEDAHVLSDFINGILIWDKQEK